MSLNITKGNLEPFVNEIFNKAKIPSPFTYDSFFEKSLQDLPTIPSIYFRQQDTYGTGIINNYYQLTMLFNRLEKIKDTIKFILNTSNDELNNIIINLNKYNINKKNMIFTVNDSYNNDFKINFDTEDNFNIFLKKFIDQKYNIFNNISYADNSIIFYYIFQHEYKNKSNQKYFLMLFNEYVKVKKEITNLIQNNYGLLAFESVFNLDKRIEQFDKNKKNKINKINKKINKSNNINYSKYKTSSNGVNNGNLSINNQILTSKKYNFDHKINEYNLLYSTNINKSQLLKLEHNQKILNLFKNAHDSLNNIFNINNINLCDFIINNLEYDFNILKFIFNYVQPELFNNFIDNDQKIKNYIFKKMGVFDVYYDLYIIWWEKLAGISTTLPPPSGNINLSDFKSFFDQQLQQIMR